MTARPNWNGKPTWHTRRRPVPDPVTRDDLRHGIGLAFVHRARGWLPFRDSCSVDATVGHILPLEAGGQPNHVPSIELGDGQTLRRLSGVHAPLTSYTATNVWFGRL